MSTEINSAPAIANVEAEAGLLGALLLEAKLIDPAADKLHQQDFYEPLHGRIFAAIVAKHAKGERANAVTLRPMFERDAAIDQLGGPAYLTQICGSGASIVGAMSFADQIREMSRRRSFAKRISEALDAAGDCGQPIDKVTELADAAVTAIREGHDGDGELSGAEALKLVIDAFDQPVSGVTCGAVPSIDTLLGPLRPTHLIIGAGRPGMGKTATAVSLALGAAGNGHGVLFISQEMDAVQLAERMASDLCLDHRVPYSAIRDRKLTVEQKRRVAEAYTRLQCMPLQIIDRSGLTISRLRTAVRRWKRRFEARGQKLELVVVDYLQLMEGSSPDGRYGVVTDISRGLKAIAKDEGLAVLALSQLSRKVEERADKRPMLSDLRESGQIEQDADAVIFFYRPEYYLLGSEPAPADPSRAKWEQSLEACQGRIEFICAKRRNGRTGSLTGQFLGEYQAVRG